MKLKSRSGRVPMKQIATAVLLLNLGVASLYAQQRPVKMTFSGSMVPTSIDLGPNTITDEELLAGNGALGAFTLRKLRTDALSPRPVNACADPTQFDVPVVAGAGVFRFQDGSLLTVMITGGDLCIDFMAGVGHLTETYQITGGTGRFEGAKGNFTSTATLRPVLFNASNAAVFLTSTGEFEGMVSGAKEGERQDERQ